jgi:hypothetical protein
MQTLNSQDTHVMYGLVWFYWVWLSLVGFLWGKESQIYSLSLSICVLWNHFIRRVIINGFFENLASSMYIEIPLIYL